MSGAGGIAPENVGGAAAQTIGANGAAASTAASRYDTSQMDLATPKLIERLILDARTGYPKIFIFGLLLIQMKRFVADNPPPKASTDSPAGQLVGGNGNVAAYVSRFFLSFVCYAYAGTVAADVVFFARTPKTMQNPDLFFVWLFYFFLYHVESIVLDLFRCNLFYTTGGGSTSSLPTSTGSGKSPLVAAGSSRSLMAQSGAVQETNLLKSVLSLPVRFFLLLTRVFRDRVLNSAAIQTVAKVLFTMDLTRVSFNVLEASEKLAGVEDGSNFRKQLCFMSWGIMLFTCGPGILRAVFFDTKAGWRSVSVAAGGTAASTIPSTASGIGNKIAAPATGDAAGAGVTAQQSPAGASTSQPAKSKSVRLELFLKTNYLFLSIVLGNVFFYLHTLYNRCADFVTDADVEHRSLARCLHNYEAVTKVRHPYVESVLVTTAFTCALDLFLYALEYYHRSETVLLQQEQATATKAKKLQ
ncbi:unnamed protein product [Amoebophrya sp. A120]|nr:unnamed protein product [Amoebophrya sp. A120]|eukprot:GSA120T00025235001.1